jgi:hypothetical protein
VAVFFFGRNYITFVDNNGITLQITTHCNTSAGCRARYSKAETKEYRVAISFIKPSTHRWPFQKSRKLDGNVRNVVLQPSFDASYVVRIEDAAPHFTPSNLSNAIHPLGVDYTCVLDVQFGCAF